MLKGGYECVIFFVLNHIRGAYWSGVMMVNIFDLSKKQQNDEMGNDRIVFTNELKID